MKVGRRATLLIGGARSGKSDLAVRLGEAWAGDVTLVATAEAGDADMGARIARHQAERPAHWACVEAPLFSAADLDSLDDANGDDHLVIIDCLTMLTTNLLFQADSAEASSDDKIVDLVADIARAAERRAGPTLLVSNEVGLGVHPATELGRRYRDLHGRANRAVASEVSSSLFVVAGKALPLEELEVSW